MWIDDDILRRAAEPMALHCFVPSRPFVILGSSNVAEVEANVEACTSDGVPILKRYGGGGTVVLYEGSAVVSLGLWVRQHFQNKLYFELLNGAVIDALALRWPNLARLSQNGLSDIVDGDRKVAGTSLFRSRNYLLYQASILVDLDLARIARYLRHPSREPDYRKGRRHADFLKGLGVGTAACAAQLQTAMPAALAARLAGELIEPQREQIASLHARVVRSELAETSS